MTEHISNPKSFPANKVPAEIIAEVLILIENFPRIGNRIVLLWGSIDLQNYLNTLIVDERGGRQGFPHPVAEALLRIHTKHSKIVSENESGNEVKFEWTSGTISKPTQPR